MNKNHGEKLKNFYRKNYILILSYRPEEQWQNWKGNKVHLDTFRNQQAKAKVILFHGVGTNGRQMSTY